MRAIRSNSFHPGLADADRERLALSGLVIAASAGTLLGVASVLVSPLAVLVGLLALVFLVVMVLRPEFGLLAILVATSSIVFENELPLVSIGVGSLHLSDVVLLGLLGLIVVRALAEPEFKIVRTPLDLPLLAFYATGILATLLALWRSAVPAQEALRAMRVFTYYLTFFVVTNLIRRRVQLVFLVNGLLLMGTFVAGAMIAQFLLGDSVMLFPGRIESLQTQGRTFGSITRVLPPGQSLVMVGPVVVVVFLVLHKFGSSWIGRLLQAGLLGLGLILTFNRNFWVAVGFALLLLMFLGRGHDRRKLFGLAMAALLLAVMVLATVSGETSSKANRLASAVLVRMTTLITADTLHEDSLDFRYLEYAYAVPVVMSHPLLGLGLGAQYRPWDRRLDWEEFDGRGYIHNGHMWIMLTTGLLGYACLLWLSIRYVVRALRSWRQIADPLMRATVLSFALAYIGAMVAAIVNPIYMQWFWTPLLGIMMGASETILASRKEQSPDGQTVEGLEWQRV